MILQRSSRNFRKERSSLVVQHFGGFLSLGMFGNYAIGVVKEKL
jgi:hypothetical protein